MKRRMRVTRERTFPSTILFMIGFLVGMFVPNFFWKEESGKNFLSSFYLLTTLQQANYIDNKVLFDIWKQKGGWLLLTVLSGFTIFGVPLAVLEMLLLGFFTSALLTVSILRFGIYGSFLGTALCMPQALFYYPACFLLLSGTYHESLLIWKRKGALPERMSGYGACVLFTVFLAFLGSLMEAYWNPVCLRWILRRLPIY